MRRSARPPCACSRSCEHQRECRGGRTGLWDEKWGTGRSRPPATRRYTSQVPPARPAEEFHRGIKDTGRILVHLL